MLRNRAGLMGDKISALIAHWSDILEHNDDNYPVCGSDIFVINTVKHILTNVATLDE